MYLMLDDMFQESCNRLAFAFAQALDDVCWKAICLNLKYGIGKLHIEIVGETRIVKLGDMEVGRVWTEVVGYSLTIKSRMLKSAVYR